MKRKFTMALALASFLALATSLSAPTSAQISLGGGGGGTSLPVTADTTLANDNIYVGLGSDDDATIEYVSSSDILVIGNTTATVSSVFTRLTSNAASSESVVEYIFGPGIGDGSDVYKMFNLDIANVDHTGSSNEVHGIYIDDITGDAEATESGITVGTGWDYGISVADDVFIAAGAAYDYTIEWDNGTATTRRTSLGGMIDLIPAGQFWRIWNGAAYSFAYEATTTTDAFTFIDTVTQTGGGTTNFFDLQPTAAIMDGSDTLNGILLSLTNADHTTGSNAINGIMLANITGDAQAEEIGLNIGTGWDTRIHVGGASPILGFDQNNTVFVQDSADQNMFEVIGVAAGPTFRLNHTATGTSSWTGIAVDPYAGVAMDGSDSLQYISVEPISDNHTGTGNTLIGLNFDAITGDADATESAIKIGDGWDADIEATTNFSLTIDDIDAGVWKVAQGTLTATQVRKLNATPVEVIAAPGSGKAIVVESIQWMLDYGGTVYDSVGTGEDIRVRYTSSNLRMVDDCDETTCLVGDATADSFATQYGKPNNVGTMADNDGIEVVIQSAEWASTDDDSDGNSPLHYLIRYRVVTLDLS